MASTADLKGSLDVRRKIFLARGGVSDLHKDCIVVPDREYDIQRSIFAELDQQLKQVVKQRVVKPYWSDAAVVRADAGFKDLPHPPQERQALLDFMVQECNFKLEHADGSFMDHLTFCRDYCAIYYPRVSPTPLFIHSILGVGTNIFPMDKSKIPKLAAILTPDEMAHVQAFPSVLRILQNSTLVDALRAAKGRYGQLRGLRLHRLIDNAPIRLSAEQLWVQLNYQLVHSMDFLPVADWPGKAGELQMFLQLRQLLTDAGRLEVQIDVDLTPFDTRGGQAAVGDILSGAGGKMAQERQLLTMFTAERSAAIGHSLHFELDWATTSKL